MAALSDAFASENPGVPGNPTLALQRHLAYACTPMNLRFDVEHRDGYSVVRVEGAPSLGQFLSFIHLIGVETAGGQVKRVLFDLRGVETLTTFTEHYAIGDEAARQLSHLQRVASLVEPHRITRASEKTAQREGMNLVVFTDEAAAVEWLTA